MAAKAPSDFFERVWEVVAEIPFGTVTTYGHIAAHLGSKRAAPTLRCAQQPRAVCLVTELSIDTVA